MDFNQNNGNYISIPPIPPAGIPGVESFSSGLSATIASGVTSNPAIEGDDSHSFSLNLDFFSDLK